jgi:hypothetical protein
MGDPKPDAAPATQEASKKPRLSQEEVPSFSLEQALRVPRAIAESYAYKATRPLNVAGAMKMSPTSGPFRSLTGAAIAYGLTTGGAFAPEIGITPLGMRIVRPTREGDDLAAKRESVLRPKVVGDFLRQYDGAALPADSIAKNVLLEKGVPMARLDDVLALIIDGATAVGFLKDINGKRYVDLAGVAVIPPKASQSGGELAANSGEIAPRTATPVGLTLGSGININIEIHIAADAAPETIEEIFKNMRRYVLGGDGTSTSQAS